MIEIVRQRAAGIIPLYFKGPKATVLLVQHAHTGAWGFPKGKIEPGEEELACATRELFEETGCAIDALVPQVPPLIESYHFYREGKEILKKVTYFVAKISGQIRLQTEEVADYRLVDMEKVSKCVSFESGQIIFDRARAYMADLEL